MGKLRIKRRAYKRKSYTRRGGVRVKAAKVPATTFSVRDRGKPGRTPKAERFYHPKVKTGWKKSQNATTRRRLALKAHGGDYLATARSLIALHNAQTDPETKRLAKQDYQYFLGLHNKQKG